MKRLLLAALFLVTPVKAEGLVETWKELSKYRAVAGMKAMGTTALIYYAAGSISRHGEQAYVAAGDRDFYVAVDKAVTTGGMAYVTWKLLYNYLRPQVKQALLIK